MTMDNAIFGLRFGSNAALQPPQEELRIFLLRRKQKNSRELNGDALTVYNRLLEDVLSFQRRQLQETSPQQVREKMFYGVLSHSCFFNPALKSAMEQYLFQMHALITLDFVKPEAFIIAAREAMKKLNPKKKADAANLLKIRDMADERTTLLETLDKQRVSLVEELGHIALYIRDNLVRIGDRCETSIVLLVDSQLARKEENRLIADIKTHFKEKLKNDLHDGLVTRQHLEAAQQEVALLSRDLSNIFRDNIFALTGLFEAIYDRVRKYARELDDLLAEHKKNKQKSFNEEAELFTRIEQALVGLVSEVQFSLKTAETQPETTHLGILMEKRQELLDHLIERMQMDRRSRTRRHREKRRSDFDLQSKDPKRRSENDRRTKKDRRKSAGASL